MTPSLSSDRKVAFQYACRLGRSPSPKIMLTSGKGLRCTIAPTTGGRYDADVHHIDRMQLVFERCDDAEIAAAAPQYPEQVFILGRSGDVHGSVGDHDLR